MISVISRFAAAFEAPEMYQSLDNVYALMNGNTAYQDSLL
jgi:hypothetical protein